MTFAALAHVNPMLGLGAESVATNFRERVDSGTAALS